MLHAQHICKDFFSVSNFEGIIAVNTRSMKLCWWGRGSCGAPVVICFVKQGALKPDRTEGFYVIQRGRDDIMEEGDY